MIAGRRAGGKARVATCDDSTETGAEDDAHWSFNGDSFTSKTRKGHEELRIATGRAISVC